MFRTDQWEMASGDKKVIDRHGRILEKERLYLVNGHRRRLSIIRGRESEGTVQLRVSDVFVTKICVLMWMLIR